MIDQLLEELARNPHFMTLPDILRSENIDERAFKDDLKKRLGDMLAAH